jgi:ubiquinone/menaquinone biosynthesis C-methylase UbiE
MTDLPDLAATTADRIAAYLHSVDVSLPVGRFVTLVSNTYHRNESQSYDDVHAEILESAAHWAAGLRAVAAVLPPRIRVLDLGSGTGFAAEQVLRAFGPRVDHLVCQDLSTDMLAIGRTRLAAAHVRANFVAGDAVCLLGVEGGFDLVVTNAVLHHLVDLGAFLRLVGRLVKPGGVYVAGHEPSADFYANAAVFRYTRLYRRWRGLRKFTSCRAYLRKLGVVPRPRSPEDLTNDELLRASAIAAPLPMGVIRQLVDIHVPPATGATPFFGEPGFSAPTLCRKYLAGFTPYYLSTYPHVKDARKRMGPLWRGVDVLLSRAYPTSGANFLMAVRRDIA